MYVHVFIPAVATILSILEHVHVLFTHQKGSAQAEWTRDREEGVMRVIIQIQCEKIKV